MDTNLLDLSVETRQQRKQIYTVPRIGFSVPQAGNLRRQALGDMKFRFNFPLRISEKEVLNI